MQFVLKLLKIKVKDIEVVPVSDTWEVKIVEYYEETLKMLSILVTLIIHVKEAERLIMIFTLFNDEGILASQNVHIDHL